MTKLLLVASACVMLSACVTDPATSADGAEDKAYRTGSNIPARQREGVIVMSPEEVERQRAASSGNMGKGRGN